MTINSTNLSIPGVIKWLLLIAALPCLVKAWQGIIGRETATGYGRGDAARAMLLTGPDALRYGMLNLLGALALCTAAWAIWHFWQQYED